MGDAQYRTCFKSYITTLIAAADLMEKSARLRILLRFSRILVCATHSMLTRTIFFRWNESVSDRFMHLQ